ncbi:MAG: SDR family oxidoreductase [Geminicoccaceae bacterium]|nr:SDR family oxidoreductase [Geminicoccaceae bacterium]
MAAGQGVALVTGGATRIGRALAFALGARGFDVAVHYHRSAGPAGEVVEAIQQSGRRSAGCQADLGDPTACRSLFAAAEAALGPIRLLVNSAAIFEFDRPDSVSDDSWSRHMAVNLHAPFLLAQAMHRRMGDEDGLIVNLIDQRAFNPTPNFTSYTVSKMALAGLTRHLALALAPRLRVNGIAPGLVRLDDARDDQVERLAASTPLRRATGVDELVRALGYFIDCRSVTGDVLVLDSGMHLGWRHPEPRERRPG